MNVRWMKCQGDVWCKLDTVNLYHPHFEAIDGVYIIWHGGSNPHVVYVGQGRIRDRLSDHRRDERIREYGHLDLFVTWAHVPEQSNRHGIEAYLIDVWMPKVNEKHPGVAPRIAVNPPW